MPQRNSSHGELAVRTLLVSAPHVVTEAWLSDIDSVLGKIEEVASNRDGIASEEALILKGYSLHLPWLGMDVTDSTALQPSTRPIGDIQGSPGKVER